MRVKAAVLSAVLALTLTACADRATLSNDGPASQVPEEFKAACGRPGTEVRAQSDEGLVRHADCDLTGVTVVRDGRGGAVVPAPGEGVGNSLGFNLWRAANGDVGFRVQGETPPSGPRTAEGTATSDCGVNGFEQSLGDASPYLGLTAQELQDISDRSGLVVRVFGEDATCSSDAITSDLRADRVNVHFQKGRVAAARVF